MAVEMTIEQKRALAIAEARLRLNQNSQKVTQQQVAGTASSIGEPVNSDVSASIAAESRMSQMPGYVQEAGYSANAVNLGYSGHAANDLALMEKADENLLKSKEEASEFVPDDEMTVKEHLKSVWRRGLLSGSQSRTASGLNVLMPELEAKIEALKQTEAERDRFIKGDPNGGMARFLTRKAEAERRLVEAMEASVNRESNNISEAAVKKAAIEVSKGMRELAEAEGFIEKLKAVGRNPFETLSGLVVESTAQQLPELIQSTVGGLLAGPLVGSSLVFQNTLRTEHGSKMIESLQDQGMDIEDPESIAETLMDAEALREASNAGYRKAIPVALFAAFSGAKIPVGGKLSKQIGVEVGTQVSADVAGETLGQMWSDGEVDFGEVFEEVVAGMSQNLAESGVKVSGNVLGKLKPQTEEGFEIFEDTLPGKFLKDSKYSEQSFSALSKSIPKEEFVKGFESETLKDLARSAWEGNKDAQNALRVFSETVEANAARIERQEAEKAAEREAKAAAKAEKFEVTLEEQEALKEFEKIDPVQFMTEEQRAEFEAEQEQLTAEEEAELERQFLEEQEQAAMESVDLNEELLDAVRREGGLMKSDPELQGEIDRIADNMKEAKSKKVKGLFKRQPKSLERLREGLNERGFDFDTIADMLFAIEGSVTGTEQFPIAGGGIFTRQRVEPGSRVLSRAERIKVEKGKVRSVMKKQLEKFKQKAKEQRAKDRLKAESQKSDIRIAAAKRLQSEINKRIKDVRKLMDQRKNVTKAIKELEQLVQMLPLKVRGKFRGFGKLAGKVTTEAQQKQINESIGKIQGIFEDFFRRETQNQLRKALSLVQNLSTKAAKRMDLKITPDIRESMKLAFESATTSKTEAISKAEDFRQEDGSFKNEQDLLDYYLATTFAGVLTTEATVSEINAARGALAFMVETGKTRAKFLKEERDAEIQRIIDGSVDAVSKEKDGRLSPFEMDEKEQKLLNASLRRVKHWGFDTLDGLQHVLDNLAVKGERFQTFLHEEIFTPVTEATLDKFDRIQKLTEEFRASVWNTLGDKTEDTLSQWGKIQDSGVRFISSGVSGEKRMTVWQGIQLYMRTLEGGNENTLLKMIGKPDGDSSDVDVLRSEVVKFIGDDGVAMAKKIQSIYKKMGEEFIAESERIDGIRPDVVDNYAGPIRRRRSRQVEEDMLSNMNAYQSFVENAKNGSFKERTKSTEEIVIEGAHQTLMSHIHSMSHAYAFADWARKVNALISDPEFRRAVRQRSGSPETIKLLKRQLDLVARGHVVPEVFDNMMSGLIKTISLSKLVLNYASAIKQLASIPAFMDSIPVKAFLKYAAKLTPGKIREMRETRYMRERYSAGMDRVLRDIKRWNPKKLQGGPESIYAGKNAWNTAKRMLTTDLGKFPSFDEILDAGMFMTQEVDALAIAIGGRVVYDYHYDQKLAETGDPVEASRFAEIKFAEASNFAQQSALTQDLGWFQTLGSLGKLLTSYATSPIQYQRNVNNALRAFKNGRISGVQLAKTAFIFHVLMPQIFTAMGSLISAIMFEDERDWEKVAKRQKQAAILGNLNVLPLFGMAVQKFSQEYTDMQWKDPSVVVFDTMNQLGGGLANLILGLEEGDEEKIENGLSDTLEAGGSIIGAPTAITKKTFDAVSED